ncbi:MAG TPA: cyclase family protein [Aliidongia sp.]|uniref:cyclase family protein n=1 Tax=Aliidongia sp. TaxID=1914230 RepID=UPI002DDCDFD1|nr:cyclase family protein [Aliidongia sp.]HEV2676405.1 cyclase family protein [Aliidongia sp.]
MGRSIDDHRVAFDFEIAFSNGGGIKGWDFRLDIDGTDISDTALADYIVQDLRLLMVGSVKILNKRIFQERHKRAAGHSPSGEGEGGATLVDLSHAVRDGQTTYPGLPALAITDHLSHLGSHGRYADGVSFQIGRIDMVANSGTAIDAPYHRFPGMADVAELPLSHIADLAGLVVRLGGMTGRAVTRQALLPALGDVAGSAVLIETGWSRRWETPGYFVDHPFLTQDAVELLRDRQVALVGIDSLNIDDTGDPDRPAHSILLAAGIPIVENLTNLGDLPTRGFHFSAVPMRAVGMGAFPVRAWARLAKDRV